MNYLELEKFFEENEKEFLKFGNIENPLNMHPQINAMMILEKYVPNNAQGTGKLDIIVGSDHDTIYFNVETNDVNIHESELLDLIRCGVSYSIDNDGFYMFI